MLLSNFKIDERYFAHTPNELLSEHLENTKRHLYEIIDKKNLNNIIDSLIKDLDERNFTFIKELFINAIYLHDLGKKNPNFQVQRLKNKIFLEEQTSGDSKHSKAGATEYIKYYREKISKLEINNNEKIKLLFITYSFAYSIEKHHTFLKDMTDEFKNDIQHGITFDKFKPKDYKIDRKKFYILNKLLYSLLISSDYFATIDYMKNIKIDDFGLFSKQDKITFSKKIKQKIDTFDKTVPINILRDKIANQAIITLNNNLDKNIFFLESPTGSGKTITSFKIADVILNNNNEINKIFYIFPFNTLVEQTKSVFDDIFNNEIQSSIINSTEPIHTNKEEEYSDDIIYADRLFYNTQTVFTTHVKLFEILFGTNKQSNFPLFQLANSIIIIDEIQSYNNKIWNKIIEFLYAYSKALNIKILIMSATLPNLGYFIEDKKSIIELIPQKQKDIFFQDKIFRKRIKINTLDFSKKIDLDKLADIVINKSKTHKKILIEFIKKQTARDFYNLIKNRHKTVFELSGDDNKAQRNLVIESSKKDISLIIVATQVIEAGVDIDMDYGFKDYATLDSEEQFMGRINRNCLKENCGVTFFNHDNAKDIYRDDNRINHTILLNKYLKILKDKDFTFYYEIIMNIIKEKSNSYTKGVNTPNEDFTKKIRNLSFSKIEEDMKLIDNNYIMIFLPFKINIQDFNIKEFNDIYAKDFIDNNKLDGKKVWKRYKELVYDFKGSYATLQIEISKIKSLMQFFTFNVYKQKRNPTPTNYTEEIGNIFYIEDYKDFVSNGMFQRDKYSKKLNSDFI